MLLDNMWTVANAIGADQDDDYDLGEDGKFWNAVVFLSNMSDDPAALEIGEGPEGALSEVSEMIQRDFYLKFGA